MRGSAAAAVERAATSWWARLLITAVILIYLASRIDMGAAARAVVTVDPLYLTAVLALVALDRTVMILRWVLLLRASGVRVTAKRAASIFLVSSFVGSFLPAGVGGDAARAWGLSRETSEGSEALASVLVDRVLGILSLVAMAIVGLIAWTPSSGVDWRAGAAIAFLVVACYGVFWADRLIDAVRSRAVRGHAVRGRAVRGQVRNAVPFGDRSGTEIRSGTGPERGAVRGQVRNDASPGVVRKVSAVANAIGRYRGRRGTLVSVMVWSIAVQVLRIVQAYLLGLGLGIAVPFRYYLLFMPIGLLMLLLPISVSGFGLPQSVIVWLLRPMGVPDEQSFALSTLIVLTGLAGNLPGLWLWLRQRREIL